MANILIIDDEPGIRTVLQDILEDEGYTVNTAEDGLQGIEFIKNNNDVDLVFLDVWLPNMGGIDVLQEIKKDFPDIEIIVISGHANINIAVKAIKLGAFDFIEKPLSLEKVTTLARNALHIEKLKKENKTLKESIFIEDQMIGSSPQMQEIRDLIDQSAGSDSRILILGENGTGKELIAKEIHRKSNRSNESFIEVNCAAIPDTLIESELFGHEKGAFTSAVSQRKGKFELAHNGTLFMDEVADMSLQAQAKVLRAIQELRFERVGGEKSISVDVRIISATNKDIQQEVAEGNFREDLFFRLNVIPIFVPPLRERKEDIVDLTNYFMDKFKRNNNMDGKKISPEGINVMLEYAWPGNIRELKNFIERINIMTDENIVSAEVVETYIGDDLEKKKASAFDEFKDMKLNDAKDKFEYEFLVEKLEENEYNISRTAQTLGIYPSNLHSKIKKYNIEMKK